MTQLAEVLPFAELLERAAFVIRTHADELRRAHTIAGRWPPGEEEVRDEFDEHAALANQLAKSAKYHRPNPLGGPAVVFDACADSIRAGDSIDSAMSAYGLAWRRRLAVLKKLRAAIAGVAAPDGGNDGHS
jgi:hypothetical protein